jgi:outer membrane biosynthesis protein TonB
MSQELHEPETPAAPTATAPPIPPRPAAPSSRRTVPVRSPQAAPRPHKSPTANVYPDEEDGFFAKHKVKLIVAGVVVVATVLWAMPRPKAGPAPRKVEQIVMVQVPPPPPPVKPPPPPPPQKIEEKMEKETAPTEAPKEAPKAPPKADNPPPTALATGIKGDGPGMGLASSGNGLGGGNLIGGTGTGGATGSKWGWYAGQVQSKIADALRHHPKTKTASISGLQVRIWPDTTGRITRASLAGSTGQADVDAAIEREILSGLQLQEPPPAGMKLPIVLRVSAKR